MKDNPEVKELIKDTWKKAENKSVMDRIALTRPVITEWRKAKKQNSRLETEQKKAELEAALTSPLNDIVLFHKITSELADAYIAEEAYWRQRSRLMWLQLGDKNSGFFHATTKNRKRVNGFL